MLTVATFNVNSVRSRMPILTKWLAAEPVDVVALQELKGDESKFPLQEFQELGYHVVVHGQKAYNGVAIVSREPFEDYMIPTLPFCTDGEARVILAKVRGIWFVNTYIPQGQSLTSEKFPYKLAFLAGMGKYLRDEGLMDAKTIWLGDLNVALEDRDVYNPDDLRGKVTFHPDEQNALREAAGPMVDVLRKHNQDEGVYTFWDYRIPNGFKRNLGWRIDYILATPELAEYSEDAWVETGLRALEKPSDHTPLVARFDL